MPETYFLNLDRAGVLFLSTERNGTIEVDRDDLRSTCPTPSFSKQGQLKKVVHDNAQYLGARSSYLGRKILLISYLGRNTSSGCRISTKSFILFKKKKKEEELYPVTALTWKHVYWSDQKAPEVLVYFLFEWHWFGNQASINQKRGGCNLLQWYTGFRLWIRIFCTTLSLQFN